MPNVPLAQKSFWLHPMELLGEWVMSHLVSIYLEMVLVSVQGRCTLCAKHTMAQKSFWTHPMEILGDTGHVESCFSLFGDDVRVGVRQVHGLRQTYHRLRNHFGCTDGTPR